MYISVCYILLCVALHQRSSWLGGTLHQWVVHLWLDGIWMCLLYRTNNDVNIIWLYPSPFLIFPSCTSTQDQRSRALSPKFHCSIWAWLLLSANQAPSLRRHHILRTSCLCMLSASFHPAEHQVTILKATASFPWEPRWWKVSPHNNSELLSGFTVCMFNWNKWVSLQWHCWFMA